ncbi:MAG: class I SAM-dependent methyltransferase [Pirellulales bacterium]|nr:class I SAM-dependent methyltransferase [Pirellulales bacterium]
MDSSYAATYRTLYENHWWWRAREAAITREIEMLFEADGSHDILDVGCGDGLMFERLAPYGRIEGVEIDPAAVAPNSRWRDQIHFGPFDGSIRSDRRYDLILLLDVLEHLPDPTAALKHARALLKPQGALLMTVPAFNILWTSHDDLNHHFTRYTKRSFHALAVAAGIRLQRMRYLFHWTFPAKLVVRCKEAVFPTAATPPRLPPPLVNTMLTVMSKCEQASLGRLPVPFGSSLLAVGRPSGVNECGHGEYNHLDEPPVR